VTHPPGAGSDHSLVSHLDKCIHQPTQPLTATCSVDVAVAMHNAQVGDLALQFSHDMA
jgi:hypothetical protein